MSEDSFVLGKIAKEQAAGISVYVEEMKRLTQIVEEYKSFFKRKLSEPPTEAVKRSSFQKKNRSQNESSLKTLPKSQNRVKTS